MAASPHVLINDGPGPDINPDSTGIPSYPSGANVTPGNVISIRLASADSVGQWTLKIVGTDEDTTSPTLAGVDPTTGIVSTPSTVVTFTVPPGVAGQSYIFQSMVNNGGPAYTTTFGIYTLTLDTFRVGAVGERFENDSVFGWARTINRFIKRGGGGSTVASGLVTATTVVGIASATAPTAGQVLTATSDTEADWETPSSGPAPSLQTTTIPVDVSAAVAPSAGQVLTAVDPTHATWQPGGGGATLTNLTSLVFVDQSTTVPSPDQNGNIETPFATLVQGVSTSLAVLGIQVAPETYFESLTLPASAIVIRNAISDDISAANAVIFGSPIDGLSSSATLQLIGITLQNTVSAQFLQLTGCKCQSSSAQMTSGGDFGAVGSNLYGVTAVGQILLTTCTLNGNITAPGGGTLTSCSIPVTINIDTNGVVFMDGSTYSQWLSSGSTLTGSGSIVVQNGGFSLTNLSSVVFVDQATTSLLQNGNIETPFALLAAGLTATPANGTLYVAHADYDLEGSLTITQSLSVIGFGSFGSNQPSMFAPQVASATVVSFQNFQFDGPFGPLPISCFDTSSIVFINGCTLAGVSIGQVHAQQCTMGFASFDSGTFDHCTLNPSGPITLTGTTLKLTVCDLLAPLNVTFIGSPGTITLDGYTYSLWLSTSSSVANGSVVVIGGGVGGPAPSLQTTTIPVDVSAAVAPSAGQSLVATDSTHATWQYSPIVLVTVDLDLTTTANPVIDTRPSSPTGGGRWKLISIDLRVTVQMTGSGTPSSTLSIGSTSGGQEIVLTQTILPAATVGTIVGGFALSSLGSDMAQANGFEALYPAGQTIYANVTQSGTPATGTVTAYLLWQELP